MNVLFIYLITLSSYIKRTQKRFHKPDSGCTSVCLVILHDVELTSACAVLSVCFLLTLCSDTTGALLDFLALTTNSPGLGAAGDWSVFCALSSDDHWKPHSGSLSSCPVTTDCAELHTFPQHKPFILSNKCNLLNSGN